MESSYDEDGRATLTSCVDTQQKDLEREGRARRDPRKTGPVGAPLENREEEIPATSALER